MFHNRVFRPFMAIAAVLAATVLVVGDVDARAGGSSSAGSRGSRTFTAPPTTKTAPTTATPMERSMTQPGQIGQTSAATRPTTGGGFFNRPGLVGGLIGGF